MLIHELTQLTSDLVKTIELAGFNTLHGSFDDEGLVIRFSVKDTTRNLSVSLKKGKLIAKCYDPNNGTVDFKEEYTQARNIVSSVRDGLDKICTL